MELWSEWVFTHDSTASEYEPAVNEVEVPVVNRELCNSWLQHRDLNVTEGMICAGYPEGGKDACQVLFYHFLNQQSK
jgi:corin